MGIDIKGTVDIAAALNKLGTELPANVARALNIVGFSALAIAQTKSPVAHKNGGTFRAAWQVQQYAGDGCVAGIEIANNLRYARPLEYGSPAGARPWPSAGPLTVVNGGRVFSKQAPTGVLTPELPGLAKLAAETILKALK